MEIQKAYVLYSGRLEEDSYYEESYHYIGLKQLTFCEIIGNELHNCFILYFYLTVANIGFREYPSKMSLFICLFVGLFVCWLRLKHDHVC